MPQLTVNGARHYYRLEGDPSLPAIALLHPIGADLGLWDRVVPLLTTTHHVLRYDLRGHGGTETTAGEYSLDMLAGDLLALTTSLGLEKFAACGVSMGAMTSVHAAVLAPKRVTALVMCSAPTHLHPPPGGWDGRARQALDDGMAPLAAPMIARMFSEPFRNGRDPAIETLRTSFLQMDKNGYASACAVLRDADLSEELANVKAPSLVVNGDLDMLVPPKQGAEVADAIAGSSHVVLSCGHFPPLEAAASFSVAVATFLAGHSR